MPDFSPSRLAASALQVLPRKSVSRALGELASIERPGASLEAVISVYCRAYGIDLSDYELPRGGFETFDAFFTRALKPGVRPLDPDPEAVVSPADGRLEDCGAISSEGELLIKGTTYSVSELLGGAEFAKPYTGGQFMVVYLSPSDYHRFHAPVGGRVAACQQVDGTLYPVNRIGLQHVPHLFSRNERVVVHQQSAWGPVCTALVGAIGVGRISIAFEPAISTNEGPPFGTKTYPEVGGPSLERGQELGMFHLGSTAIVFLSREGGWQLTRQAGDVVRMGEAVARRLGG